MHKSQATSPESQNAPFNKSLSEATSSMTHLSTTALHDATTAGGDKDSNEKRIEVRTSNLVKVPFGNAASILTRSTSVITSSSHSSSISENKMEKDNNSIGNRSSSILINSFLLR